MRHPRRPRNATAVVSSAYLFSSSARSLSLCSLLWTLASLVSGDRHSCLPSHQHAPILSISSREATLRAQFLRITNLEKKSLCMYLALRVEFEQIKSFNP